MYRVTSHKRLFFLTSNIDGVSHVEVHTTVTDRVVVLDRNIMSRGEVDRMMKF